MKENLNDCIKHREWFRGVAVAGLSVASREMSFPDGSEHKPQGTITCRYAMGRLTQTHSLGRALPKAPPDQRAHRSCTKLGSTSVPAAT
jgi:hypothetical protein